MKEGFSGYYEFLQNEIKKFRGEFDPYINYLPDIFRLLTNLLNTHGLEKEDRRNICCALGYFVAPEDVIPEELYGPAGYADDIYLCCYVIKIVKDKYGHEFLNTSWEHEDDLMEVLEYAEKKSTEDVAALGVERKILEYVGLE